MFEGLLSWSGAVVKHRGQLQINVGSIKLLSNSVHDRTSVGLIPKPRPKICDVLLLRKGIDSIEGITNLSSQICAIDPTLDCLHRILQATNAERPP